MQAIFSSIGAWRLEHGRENIAKAVPLLFREQTGCEVIMSGAETVKSVCQVDVKETALIL
jgi:hypothetical protein